MDFIPELDNNLTDEKRLELLEQAECHILRLKKEDKEEPFRLSQRDEELLRLYVLDENPKIRETTINILGYGSAITWEDAEQWRQDPDENVRFSVLFDAVWNLFWSDKPRAVKFIVDDAIRHNYMSAMVGDEYVLADAEWFDLFWPSLGDLLDTCNKDLFISLTCGILEDIIHSESIEFDDIRLQSWLKGDSIKRKVALLEVVDWLGIKNTLMLRIVETLAHDPIEELSFAAKALLTGEHHSSDFSKWIAQLENRQNES